MFLRDWSIICFFFYLIFLNILVATHNLFWKLGLLLLILLKLFLMNLFTNNNFLFFSLVFFLLHHYILLFLSSPILLLLNILQIYIIILCYLLWNLKTFFLYIAIRIQFWLIVCEICHFHWVRLIRFLNICFFLIIHAMQYFLYYEYIKTKYLYYLPHYFHQYLFSIIWINHANNLFVFISFCWQHWINLIVIKQTKKVKASTI